MRLNHQEFKNRLHLMIENDRILNYCDKTVMGL